MLKDVLARLGPRVRFVFRNFPLTEVHPHAFQAAEAAESAAAQDRFWEMHDHLFENQRRLHRSDLLRYARELGLDVERFTADLTGHAYESRVRSDFLSGVRSGVNGTPTFYVNGVRHDDSYDSATLLGALQQAAA